MNVTILDCEQRSDVWIAARIGRLTGTGAGRIWSGWDVKEGRKKGSESTQRRDLRLMLSCERITGQSQEEDFKLSPDMQRGIDQEQEAFDAYELETGRAIRRVGFVAHNELPIGCSPDGLIGSIEGGVELKNPKTATHVGYVRDGVIPEEYIPQLRHNIYVTGAAWWDFVSRDSRLPGRLGLFIRRLYAKDADLARYHDETTKFLDETEHEYSALRQLMTEHADVVGA